MKNSLTLTLTLIAAAFLVVPADALPLSTAQPRLTLRPAAVALVAIEPAQPKPAAAKPVATKPQAQTAARCGAR